MSNQQPTAGASVGLARRVTNYLGLTDPTPTENFDLSIDGVGVTSLADVYAYLNGGTALSVSRSEANRVAAVVAARNRFQAALAPRPLIQTNSANERVKNSWLEQPNPGRPRVNELSDTIADLYYDSAAYWHVTRRGKNQAGQDGQGFPLESEYVSNNRVSVDPDGTFRLDGKSVPPSEIIMFEGLHGGILHEGASNAINDALRLARAAAMFTNAPLPLSYFTDSEPGTELDSDEVQKYLADWHSMRRRNAHGYVPGNLKLVTPEWDPRTLQLDEAKRETVVDIGRGTAAELEALGVSTTSRTYFNATQVRKDFIDFALSLYSTVIEQRLSMPDCTPRGHEVTFDFDDFLRTDALTRMKTYQLGLATGAYADADEVRQEEGKPPLTPAQKRERAATNAPKAADGGRRETDPGAPAPAPAKNPASGGSGGGSKEDAK